MYSKLYESVCLIILNILIGRGDDYKLTFIVVCPSLFLIVIVVTILLVCTCCKYQKILDKLPKDEEERSSFTNSMVDIANKTESYRAAPDKAPSHLESDDEETMRKEPVANKQDQGKEEATGSNSAVVNNRKY